MKEEDNEVLNKEEEFNDVDLNEWVKNVSEALLRLANFCNEYADRLEAIENKNDEIENKISSIEEKLEIVEII